MSSLRLSTTYLVPRGSAAARSHPEEVLDA